MHLKQGKIDHHKNLRSFQRRLQKMNFHLQTLSLIGEDSKSSLLISYIHTHIYIVSSSSSSTVFKSYLSLCVERREREIEDSNVKYVKTSTREFEKTSPQRLQTYKNSNSSSSHNLQNKERIYIYSDRTVHINQLLLKFCVLSRNR